MSTEGGRPRRSAATSNKAWASLMSNKAGHEGEEDFVDETTATEQKGGVKRSASKEQASTPANARGRKKKAKLSESGAENTDTEQATSQEQLNSPPHDVKAEIKSEISKSNSRSPKKLLPTPKVTKVPLPQPAPMPQGNDNVEMIHQDFDRHQADLAEKMGEGDLEEEEELVPAERTTTKIPTKSRGRPSAAKPPPPSLTGMDDPNDEDYVEEETKPAPKRRPAPVRPRAPPPQISPLNRSQVAFRPQMSRPQTIVVRPAPVPARVVYPSRFPTVVNGGPRVVQPRYHIPQPSRNLNPASLRQPVNNNAYETPLNVLKDIEKLTEDCKKVSSPEVVSAFQLVELLRDEMERMQQHIRESNQYYRNFIEDLQNAAASQFESSQNRTMSLEQRITSLEAQLKKCSAVAHQKLLKTAVEGFRTNVSEQPPPPMMSPQKAASSQHYVIMEGEPSGMEQHIQPRDYLVQEEDYQVNHPGGYYAHDAAIQEASKELDNML
jgi:hypothetical protein